MAVQAQIVNGLSRANRKKVYLIYNLINIFTSGNNRFSRRDGRSPLQENAYDGMWFLQRHYQSILSHADERTFDTSIRVVPQENRNLISSSCPCC